jgi:hypothetical protein
LGLCVYIASFAPYALLKAVAIYHMLQARTQGEELAAGLILSGTYMIFFCLGFGGKMALIQMWMHLISRCAISSDQPLSVTFAHRADARQTWKFMRLSVTIVCVTYSVGFFFLVSIHKMASDACAAVADSTQCIPFSTSDIPSECSRVMAISSGISYYEGAFAALVAVVFTFYALMFDSLLYALLTSDATYTNLTKFQRMLISNKFLRLAMKPYAFLL